MFCVHCGNVITDGSSFCARCGRPVEVPGPDEGIVQAFRAACKKGEYFYAGSSVPPGIQAFAQDKLARLGIRAEQITAVYDCRNDGKRGFILTDTAVYHFGLFMQPLSINDDCIRIPFKDISKILCMDDGSGIIDNSWSMQMFIGEKKIADYSDWEDIRLREYVLAVNAAAKSAQGHPVVFVELADKQSEDKLNFPNDDIALVSVRKGKFVGKLMLRGIICAVLAGIIYFLSNVLLLSSNSLLNNSVVHYGLLSAGLAVFCWAVGNCVYAVRKMLRINVIILYLISFFLCSLISFPLYLFLLILFDKML